MLLPDANGPISSIRSMSGFHSGHAATWAQSRQTSSGDALVSTLCSVAHIVAYEPACRFRPTSATNSFTDELPQGVHRAQRPEAAVSAASGARVGETALRRLGRGALRASRA